MGEMTVFMIGIAVGLMLAYFVLDYLAPKWIEKYEFMKLRREDKNSADRIERKDRK